ncbi:hypothetical protein HN51_011826 [Arachis hypogaea]
MTFNGTSSWEQVPYQLKNLWRILWRDLSRRDSCGGKGEEKGGGGTSGQGHSSEAETHDQESAARSREHKHNVLPAAVTTRVSIEVGSTFGWQKIVGRQEKAIGIDRFGASAPAEKIYKEFGITKEVAAAKELS